ncbi:MAG: homoserine dehydrogenase [Elusimicrobia bacterium]|nr:homoserine dehydrogenase [Elusimicrobiota bacterium]
MRSLRLAVAGLGVVGSETVRLLKSRRESLCRRLGARLELVAVCDRRVAAEARRLGLPASTRRLTDPARLPALPGLDAVVELLGGLDAPRRLVLSCLRRGLGVVTANKRLLAQSWDELRRAAGQGRGRLHFEASVAGGIPILKALDLSLAGDRVEAVYGILNGTTNFILSRMSEGMTPAAALRRAQELGLAEKDPSLDLSGQDSADKVSVLASLVTGSWLRPGQVRTQGIADVGPEDMAFAETELGRRAKLLVVARFTGRDGREPRVEAFVGPALVPLEHPLAAVADEFNAVLVRAASAGDLMFYGKGAGAGPAASAVLGDIMALGRELVSGAAPASPQPGPAPRLADSDCAFYLRLGALDRPGVLSAVTAALGRLGISIATINQPGGCDPKSVPIIITTHPASPGTFGRALRDILALPSISRRHTVMRLLP